MADLENPKKLHVKTSDLELPDSAWLTYAVCSGGKESCGWGGWIIESLVSDHPGKQLSTHDRHLCSKCGGALVLTEASVKFAPACDQSENLDSGVIYETVPMELAKG